MSIKLVMPSIHLIFCRSLLLLPSIFPSTRFFSSESVLPIRQPKYWSFSFSISHSNEYLGLISFRIDWFDLLAVQGTLKSFLQSHSSKSINSLVLSFLYGSTLTSEHDYQKNKNHSFDQTDLCQQSDVSALSYAVQVCHSFSSKEQASLNSMAAQLQKNCLSILVIWQPTLPDMYSYTNILIINIYLVHCLPFFLLKIFQVLIFKMHLL